MPEPVAKAQRFAPLPSPSPTPLAPSGPVARVVLPLAGDPIEWASSPARLLHERLVATFAPPEPLATDTTLSLRTKLAIVVGASATLWIAIGIAVAAIV